MLLPNRIISYLLCLLPKNHYSAVLDSSLSTVFNLLLFVLLFFTFFFCGYGINFDNTSLKSIGRYKNNIMVGVWRFYWENGKLKSMGTIKNQKPDGRWKFYSDTGKLVAEGDFKDGTRTGEWTYYFGKENYVEKGTPSCPLRIGEIYLMKNNGPSVFSLYKLGQLANTRQNGLEFYLSFYPCGTVRAIEYCKKQIGKSYADTGLIRRFSPAGDLTEEINYIRDGKKKQIEYSRK